MKIETERLNLIALTSRQLELWIDHTEELEKELECEYHGYMTEAVKAMCNWAMKQPGVKHITAETECDGLASQRLLQNCGFTEYSRGETVWWRL